MLIAFDLAAATHCVTHSIYQSTLISYSSFAHRIGGLHLNYLLNFFFNCRLAKIKAWVDKNDPGAIIIPFSGAFEQKLLEFEDAELRKKYLQDNNTTRQVFNFFHLMIFTKIFSMKMMMMIKKGIAMTYFFMTFFMTSWLVICNLYRQQNNKINRRKNKP